jgi:peptidoglycan-associated lipoprotein
MKTRSLVALVAVLTISLAACSKKVKETDTDTGSTGGGATTNPSDGGSGGRYTPADLDTDACLRQRVVYFDFDQDQLKPEFQAIVACHAKYLQDRPESRMSLEGHADERGTREYNLALGERRGNAVSSAVVASGGGSGQITVVSFGEERPTCVDSTDDCWAKNRRVEIVYTAK